MPYYYDIDDYIQFDLINFIAYNIDRARIYGLEFEVAKQYKSGWSTFFNCNFQQSKTSGDQFVANFVAAPYRSFDEIPGLPEHKFNFGLKYKWRNDASLAAYLVAVSDQEVVYTDNSPWNTSIEIRNQESYNRVDVEGTYPVNERIELSVFGRNIFDEDYQERYGFPAAGSTYGIAARAGF